MTPWSVKLSAAVGLLPVLVASFDGMAAQVIQPQVRWAAELHSNETPRAVDPDYSTSSRVNLSGPRSAEKRLASTHHLAPTSVIFGSTTDPKSVNPHNSENVSVSQIREVSNASDPRAASVLSSEEFLRICDATVFNSLIVDLEWRPNIWSDDAEIVFEWIAGGKHAVVSVEGDGHLGYTMLQDGKFVSGEVVDAPVSIFPPDLREYLISA